MLPSSSRLRKHADYQRVYKAGRKQFSKQISYFFAPSSAMSPEEPSERKARIGLTVGKVMGKAVDRNRIKRRMREAVRTNLQILKVPVDVVLHPRKSVLDLNFVELEREVAGIFRNILKQAAGSSAKVRTSLQADVLNGPQG